MKLNLYQKDMLKYNLIYQINKLYRMILSNHP